MSYLDSIPGPLDLQSGCLPLDHHHTHHRHLFIYLFIFQLFFFFFLFFFLWKKRCLTWIRTRDLLISSLFLILGPKGIYFGHSILVGRGSVSLHKKMSSSAQETEFFPGKREDRRDLAWLRCSMRFDCASCVLDSVAVKGTMGVLLSDSTFFLIKNKYRNWEDQVLSRCSQRRSAMLSPLRCLQGLFNGKMAFY